MEDTCQIDVNYLLERFRLHFQQHCVTCDAGIVDEHVYFSKMGKHFFRCAFHFRVFSDICLKECRFNSLCMQSCCKLFTCIFIEIDDGDLRTLLAEQFCRNRANPVRPSRNDYRFPFHLHILSPIYVLLNRFNLL